MEPMDVNIGDTLKISLGKVLKTFNPRKENIRWPIVVYLDGNKTLEHPPASW